jgi:lipoprotein-anchoring transpeptidase ErfK/SrfK
MGSDREGVKGMTNGWTTPEYLANISAEELARALDLNGIQAHNVGADEDGVTVSFASLRSAEALLTLEGTNVTGTRYDRATSSCVKLSTSDADRLTARLNDVKRGHVV